MSRHYIYHINGTKVGVTTNIKHRKYLYRKKHGANPDLEILEVLENKSDGEVGDREWWWADRFGYERGTHYRHVRNKFHGNSDS